MTKRVITLTGISASGKSTLEKELIKRDDCVSLVTCTTRRMRPGEVDGTDYHFKTIEEFKSMIKNNKLVEYVGFNGNYYGLPFDSISQIPEGMNGILVIEPEGAKNVRDFCLNNNIDSKSIYIETPVETCVERVVDRLILIKEKGECKNSIVAEHAKRILGMMGSEQSWRNEMDYDVVFDGNKYIDDLSLFSDMALNATVSDNVTSDIAFDKKSFSEIKSILIKVLLNKDKLIYKDIFNENTNNSYNI